MLVKVVFHQKVRMPGPATVVSSQESSFASTGPLWAADEPVWDTFVCANQGALPPVCQTRLVASRQPPSRLCGVARSEEHRLNSSHLGISYAVFCLKKK